MIVAFIEHSVAFITPPSQVRTKLISLPIKDHTYLRQFLLHAQMTTYLRDLTQSIGSYSGLSGKKLGLWVLDAQVVFPLSAEVIS